MYLSHSKQVPSSRDTIDQIDKDSIAYARWMDPNIGDDNGEQIEMTTIGGRDVILTVVRYDGREGQDSRHVATFLVDNSFDAASAVTLLKEMVTACQ